MPPSSGYSWTRSAPAGSLLLDEDRDRQRRLRDVEHRRRAARALVHEDEAEQVGARLDGGVDVLLARQPAHLHERTGEQLAQLRRRVGSAHQRRADEDRVRACELGRRALRAGVDRALGHDDAVARRRRDEPQLRAAVDRERREVACVDADHRRAERVGPVELLDVVRLDERVQSELRRLAQQPRGLLVVEVAEDEQRRVGAGVAHGREVVARGEEAFREQRRLRRRACGAQVVERAREPLVDEHGDRRCAVRRVRGDELLDARVGSDVAHRRRAPLELGDRRSPG